MEKEKRNRGMREKSIIQKEMRTGMQAYREMRTGMDFTEKSIPVGLHGPYYP